METSIPKPGSTVTPVERYHTMANVLGCVLGNIELLRKLPTGDARTAEVLDAAYQSGLRLQGLLESARENEGGGHVPEDPGR